MKITQHMTDQASMTGWRCEYCRGANEARFACRCSWCRAARIGTSAPIVQHLRPTSPDDLSYRMNIAAMNSQARLNAAHMCLNNAYDWNSPQERANTESFLSGLFGW